MFSQFRLRNSTRVTSLIQLPCINIHLCLRPERLDAPFCRGIYMYKTYPTMTVSSAISTASSSPAIGARLSISCRVYSTR